MLPSIRWLLTLFSFCSRSHSVMAWKLYFYAENSISHNISCCTISPIPTCRHYFKYFVWFYFPGSFFWLQLDLSVQWQLLFRIGMIYVQFSQKNVCFPVSLLRNEIEKGMIKWICCWKHLCITRARILSLTELASLTFRTSYTIFYS